MTTPISKGMRVEHTKTQGRIKGEVLRVLADVRVEGTAINTMTYDVDNLRQIPPKPPEGAVPAKCPACGADAYYPLAGDKGCEHCTRDATVEEVTDLLSRAKKDRDVLRHANDVLQRAASKLGGVEVVAMLVKANEVLLKISEIRDSIIGRQGFHWSDHGYPLVAALEEAGFPGAGYDIAAPRERALIDELAELKAENEELRRKLGESFNDAVESGHTDFTKIQALRAEIDRTRSPVGIVGAARAWRAVVALGCPRDCSTEEKERRVGRAEQDLMSAIDANPETEAKT